MPDQFHIDARRDQLKLLKLERRKLRPMAALVLDDNKPKKVKMAAIAGVIASIMALSTAPQQYSDKLGISDNFAAQSQSVVERACLQCDEISRLIANNASMPQLFASVQQLFLVVDKEHSRFESAAKKAGARLLSFGDDQRTMGSGGKGSNASWLFSNATGSGGKGSNEEWLSQQKTRGPSSSQL